MTDHPIRGIMLDCARLLEKPRVYRDLLPLMADWGYNTLFWHFCDDQGCALRFPSHPELGSPHAWSAKETTRFVEQAARYGINVVPEVECLGHTRFITDLRAYAHLCDGAEGKQFGAIAPFHPVTRGLLQDLLGDVARIFPSPYLHIGMDEVAIGKHPSTAKLLKRSSKWELFADHVNWLHGIVTGLGKTVLMWGDHLLPHKGGIRASLDAEAIDARIVKRIPKDIIVCDWHYGAGVKPDSVDFLLREGFRVICCPALSAHRIIAHPQAWNLENMSRFSRIAADQRGPSLLGVVNTVWTPYRWLTGSILFGMALGGAWIRSAGREPAGLRRQFVRDTFGLKATAGVVKAIESLHDASPPSATLYGVLPQSRKDIMALSSEALHQLIATEKTMARTAAALQAQRSSVSRHIVYYDDLLITARCLEQISGRAARFVAVGRLAQQARESLRRGEREAGLSQLRDVHDQLQQEAKEASRLYQIAARQWNRTRYADDPKRDGRRGRTYADAFVQRLKRSAVVLTDLSKAVAKAATTGRRLPTLWVCEDQTVGSAACT